LDNGSVQTYTAPLLFPRGEVRTVKAYAEDAMGNTSGMIETTINPPVAIGNGAPGVVNIQWPVTDGWVLEECTSLAGPWTPSAATVSQSGSMNAISIPTGSDAKKFFRLRSTPIER
jgi:hypothetical protein